MKITIGLTKRAEALLRELVLGESTVVAALVANQDKLREVAEAYRLDTEAAKRKLGDTSTRLRQAEMMAEGAETRLRQAEAALTTVRALAMEAIRNIDQGTIDSPGVMGESGTFHAIIRATRR